MFFDVCEGALDRNMAILALPNAKRDCSVQQLSPDFDTLPSHQRANPQTESAFFRIAQELRDDIYRQILTHRDTSKEYYDLARCECHDCEYRRIDDGPAHVECDDAGYPVKQGVENAHEFSLFLTCRRMYDESRPVLQQVNATWFDGKSELKGLLNRMARGLSLHRGLRLPAPVLVSATFAFKFNKDLAGTTAQNNFVTFYYAHRLAKPIVSKPIEIRNLTLLIGLSGPHLISEFVPLLRTLEKIPGVKTCRVAFTFDERGPKPMKFDTDIAAALSSALEHAAVAPEPKIPNRVAMRDLATARDLIASDPVGTRIFINLESMELARAQPWDWNVQPPPPPPSRVKTYAVNYGLDDFLAASAAMGDSELDPRAAHFNPGFVYVPRAGVV